MLLIEALTKKTFTLSLSSGFFGFFAHCGFTKALENEGLKPKLITGSSAGSIVAACLASGLSALDMEKEFLVLNKSHYWDPGFGFGLLKGKTFEKTLLNFVKPSTHDLQTPLHIATFDILRRRTKVFKSSEDLPRVIRASCAVPLMFHPVAIDGRLYWDGGIQDKMGWSDVSSDEFILGHSLPADPVSRLFDNATATPKRVLISVAGLPSTGPGNFHNAAAAINLAYETTKQQLYSRHVEI